MKIRDFGLEIFFGRYEFSAPYLLAQSDCESLSIRELLALEPGAQEGFLDTWLGYSENDGAPALREAVSGLYTQCGPENVLLHVGAQEAIFGALNVLVEPGEHVICQFPTYQSLYEVARAAGCELSLWPLHQGEDGWYCDLDELERLITPKTRLLVLNTPNNPTGSASASWPAATACASWPMRSTGAWKRRMPCPRPFATSTNGPFPWACSPRPTACPACAWAGSPRRNGTPSAP